MTDNTVIDLSTRCWTCEPLQAYATQAGEFAQSVSTALQTPMVILFTSLTGLWIVMGGIKLALGMLKLQQAFIDFVYISIAAILLGAQGPGLIVFIYNHAISIMTAAASVAFEAAGGSLGDNIYTGLTALAANAERAVSRIFHVAETIAIKGNVFNPINWVYAAILVIPYFIFIIAYAAQVVVSIFRVMMIAIFAPFLFLSFAFGWSRSMAQSGAKTILATILVLFASTAALAVAIYGVNAALQDFDTLTTSTEIEL